MVKPYKNVKYIFMYLVAIVAANLSTAMFGPGASIINAFLFIGLDLTARDKLHEAWSNNHILPKMALLIVTGSLISWLINSDAGIIAIASMVSFSVAAVVDTIVYHLLQRKAYLVKINGSNLFAATADSFIFPTIAFGSFMPIVVAGQLIAKILGGFLWSIVLHRKD